MNLVLPMLGFIQKELSLIWSILMHILQLTLTYSHCRSIVWAWSRDFPAEWARSSLFPWSILDKNHASIHGAWLGMCACNTHDWMWRLNRMQVQYGGYNETLQVDDLKCQFQLFRGLMFSWSECVINLSLTFFYTTYWPCLQPVRVNEWLETWSFCSN